MQLSPIPYLLLLLLLLHNLFPSIQPALSLSHSFVYNGFDSANLTLNGIACITGNGILQLTNTTSRRIGRGFYPDPIRFRNPDANHTVLSFSTAFVFSIVPRYNKLGGHGFAFTISPTNNLTRAQHSQYLGLGTANQTERNQTRFFAVEFDTVKNLDVADINDNHVGVDINRLTSLNSTSAGFFTDGNETKQELGLHSGRKIQAWIDYDAVTQNLNVTLSLFRNKPSTPILSFPVDLSTVFQDFMYIGFSASTGLLASSHYIFGWSFNMSGKAESLDLDLLPSLITLKKSKKGFIIRFSVSLLLGFSVLVSTAVVYVIKKFKKSDFVEGWELDLNPHAFSYKELKAATKGFRDKELVGFGGSGQVYKGVLPDLKTQIAVKRISRKSKQGLTEFLSEVSTIGRLRHRNLVQLLGWSRHKGDLLLVYDFMANGSLDKYIYNPNNGRMVLSWDQRFKVIKDISKGLLYLHEEWEQTVLHRDIKAGNVLLDSDLNGRLGDFGLAKLYDHGSNPGITKVVGTMGYLAPEVTRTGRPTKSSDVYAFGALLLEVVCGRRPVELQALPEELILVDWVWDKWREGCLLSVVDPRLNCEFDASQAEVVLKVGLMCSSDDPSLRPGLRQVRRYLEGAVPLPENLGPWCYAGGKGGFEAESWPEGCREGEVDVEAGSGSPVVVAGEIGCG